MSLTQKERVVVAMSGGVDSSVAAALLKQQGHDVIGVSLKLWDYDEEERKLKGKTCCSLDDIADAKDVCAHLDIPFYAFNHKTEFQKKVIATFVDEYARGRTPNPCVLCNQFIKFDLLLTEAKKLGARFLATGHYARIEKDSDGVCHLKKGLDPIKDQSYVLFHLTQEELTNILFPVGHYTKTEIRSLARDFGLKISDKKESQDICFIPNNDVAAFIKKNYPDKKQAPGNFIDPSGTVLGRHEGIDAYTIGQRRGLKLSRGERLFVREIRPETDEVVLSRNDDLYFSQVVASGFHFIRRPEKLCYGAKLRYQRDENMAEILDFSHKKGRITLRFSAKVRAIAPGQALVLYDGDEVIGGGWIAEGCL